jgi:hypothetical protein
MWRYRGISKNGKAEREYSSRSPLLTRPEFQLKITALAASDANLVLARPDADQASLEFPTRQILPPRAHVDAERRWRAIEPLVDFRNQTNGHRPTFNTLEGRTISNMNDLANILLHSKTPRFLVQRSGNGIARFVGMDSPRLAIPRAATRVNRGSSLSILLPPSSCSSNIFERASTTRA